MNAKEDLKLVFPSEEYKGQMEEYDKAYKIANDLINQLKGNEEKLKQFTDKYLNDMLRD